MPPLPPGPEFVLRKSWSFESAINHISFFSHPVDGDCLALSDQSGKVDFWEIERQRRSIRTVDVVESSNNLLKKNLRGIVWTEVTRSSESNSLSLICSQCRDGGVYIFRMFLEHSLEQEKSVVFSKRLETGFTAFCKCDLLLKEDLCMLVSPVDKNSEYFFRVFHLDTNLFDSATAFETKNEIQCCKNYGLPMAVIIMSNTSKTRLLAAFEIGCIVLYSVETQEALAECNFQMDRNTAYTLTCIAANHDCTKVAVGSVERKISTVDITSADSVTKMEFSKTVEVTNPGLSCLQFRPDDGLLLVSAGWDSRIRYFSAKGLKQLAVLTYHTSTIVALKFVGKRLFSACKDGKVACWNLYAGE
ncbi:guanine nucleotide-binding protein subunit beta-like protein 1 [Convolutriloba macropyga]|uniref:guanine nucleotide-binding protein subunit beta-like protein 1 n=1 Tax=Convolutriloba macropyga TaxID=536237 RepID=UPI003F527343